MSVCSPKNNTSLLSQPKLNGMRLRCNFQCHNLTSSEQALKNASPLFCKLETSESSLFLGLEKKKYFSKVYFPPKWLENELLQKQVLDITFVRWVLDKTPYAKGQRQRKTSDYHHRWCLARSPSSDTIVIKQKNREPWEEIFCKEKLCFWKGGKTEKNVGCILCFTHYVI